MLFLFLFFSLFLFDIGVHIHMLSYHQSLPIVYTSNMLGLLSSV